MDFGFAVISFEVADEKLVFSGGTFKQGPDLQKLVIEIATTIDVNGVVDDHVTVFRVNSHESGTFQAPTGLHIMPVI